MIEILSPIDYLLGLIYFLILFFILYIYARKYNQTLKKYFLLAFVVRILSAYIYVFIYKVIFGGLTDTGRYYFHALDVRDMIYKLNIDTSIELLKDSTYFTGFIAGIMAALSPGNFLSISFLLTLLGFIGCWKIFITFYKIYPENKKYLAIACLFMPSVFFWGVGILKEPIMLFGLGIFFSMGYEIFIEKKINFFKIIYFVFGILLIALIKVYIVAAIIPTFFIAIYFIFMKGLKMRVIKFVSFPLVIIILTLTIIFMTNKISNFNEQYSLEKASETIKNFQDYLDYNPDDIGGSSYSIGTISADLIENLKLFPLAVNVTLFRPYIWESKKILYLPTLFEALLAIILVIYILFKIGIIKTTKIIYNDPILIFCLLFTILFAFIVGISSFNFGALMRYKIPCIPFWYVLLFMIIHKYKKNSIEQSSK